MEAVDVAAYAVQLSSPSRFAAFRCAGRSGGGGLIAGGRIATAARGRSGGGRRRGLRFAVGAGDQRMVFDLREHANHVDHLGASLGPSATSSWCACFRGFH